VTGLDALAIAVVLSLAVLVRERWRFTAEVEKSQRADYAALKKELDDRLGPIEEKVRQAAGAQMTRPRAMPLPFGG
jgi:hypothetical protein